MTKEELIKAAGMENETIDYALPQGFVDECRKLGIEAVKVFVGWHYPKGSRLGKPLSIGECYALIPENIDS